MEAKIKIQTIKIFVFQHRFFSKKYKMFCESFDVCYLEYLIKLIIFSTSKVIN